VVDGGAVLHYCADVHHVLVLGVDLREQDIHVLTAGLAFLVVVENKGIDAAHVVRKAFLQLIRIILTAAVAGGGGEMAKPALAAHAGFAQGEEGDVLFESFQAVTVGAYYVNNVMHALGEKDAIEVVLDKTARFGIVPE